MGWPTQAIITTSMDDGADDASQARAEIKKMADHVNEMKDARGAADGVASLGSDGKVPVAQLPTTAADKGGTGQTSYTIGDILYASAAGTLTKLGAGTDGYVLTSNGPGTAPSWQQSGGGLESGVRMAFQQTAAPTGWTKDTTYNDALFRVVSGTVTSGGSTAFSTFNAQSSTGAYTLTTSDIPAHTHSYYGQSSGSSDRTYDQKANTSSEYGTKTTGSAGGGGAHSHGLTHNIRYLDFIVATRD